MGLALALLLVFITYGLRSDGTYYDDDIAHFLIARYSWNHPELFLNTWGRPTFTILYAPAALAGLSAVKAFSAVLAVIASVGAGYVAKLYGVQSYWLAIVFTGFQPEFFRQAFSSLTELSFALILCLTLIAHKKERWDLLALIAGWLPLARYESLPVVFVLMLAAIGRRKYLVLPIFVLPLILQNSYWAIRQHNAIYLSFPLDQLFGLRPNTAPDYGNGPPEYYFNLMPVAYGGVCFVLACLGALRTRFGMLQLVVIVVVATLGITYWLFPAAGVAGYSRHLATVAPAVGVLAACGIEKLPDVRSTLRARRLIALFAIGLAFWLWLRVMLASCAVAVIEGVEELFRTRSIVALYSARFAVTTIFVISSLISVKPFELSAEHEVVFQAATWFKQSTYSHRLVLASHVYFSYFADLDSYQRSVSLPITAENINNAPKGTIIVWDSHYSYRLSYNTPLAMLRTDARYLLLRSWETEALNVYIFEKGGGPSAD